MGARGCACESEERQASAGREERTYDSVAGWRTRVERGASEGSEKGGYVLIGGWAKRGAILKNRTKNRHCLSHASEMALQGQLAVQAEEGYGRRAKRDD
jgi:hypothetical protein